MINYDFTRSMSDNDEWFCEMNDELCSGNSNHWLSCTALTLLCLPCLLHSPNMWVAAAAIKKTTPALRRNSSFLLVPSLPSPDCDLSPYLASPRTLFFGFSIIFISSFYLSPFPYLSALSGLLLSASPLLFLLELEEETFKFISLNIFSFRSFNFYNFCARLTLISCFSFTISCLIRLT